MEHSIVGLAWYSEEEYSKFRRASVDPKSWHPKHEDWQKAAQSHLQNATIEGCIVMKVPMILDDFMDWCSSNKAKNDSEGRSGYAAWLSKKLHQA
jgi:hypothetical protein